MDHERYQQLVSQFVDSELTITDEQELFEHLNSCSECRGFLKASWRLQADIFVTKPQLHSRGLFLADQVPFHQTYRRSKSSSRVSTVVLLVMVSLIVGILLSANVSVQRAPDFPAQEMVLPK